MLKISNGSICRDCDYFEHECNVDFGGGDYGCTEHCEHNDANIRESFGDEDVIKECKGFKE